MKRTTAALALALALPTLLLPGTGCFGKFALTKAVYKANGDFTDNKIVHSALAWVFYLLPVYLFASMADFFVLNVIEFYSGENPVAYNLDAHGDGQVAETVTRDGEAVLQVRSYAGGVETARVDVRRLPGGDLETVTFDAQGREVGRSVMSADLLTAR
jgi:hypothetical protein